MRMLSNNTETTPPNTLTLHDALPISSEDHHDAVTVVLHEGDERIHGLLGELVVLRLVQRVGLVDEQHPAASGFQHVHSLLQDRKSTRLNSSHVSIAYDVFCL